MAPRTQGIADIDAAEISTPAGDYIKDGLFVFDARPIVRNWPARVKVPVGNGEYLTHEIRVDFLSCDIDEARKLQLEIAQFIRDGGVLGSKKDPLWEKVIGWTGLATEGKGELAVNDRNKAVLLANARMRQVFLDALFRMASGLDEKNSETSPAGGAAPRTGLNRAERRKLAKKLAGTLADTE